MREKRWLILILLTAAALRLVGLNNVSPPGLEHDEVANWLIDRSILAGNHAVYFTEAYGHEAGFHYWQTLFVALVGDNALALRLPAAFAGLLVVAVTYVLARQLFGRPVAFLAMGITAVLFMPVFYSRLALRAITLPLTAGLSAYFWWRWWLVGEQRGAGAGAKTHLRRSLSPPLLLSALLAGASTYTYMASRALPIFWGFFFLYLALFHWPKFKERWIGILVFVVIYAAVSWPLVRFIQQVPEAEFRITEVDAPMRAFLAGDPWPALQNAWAILLSFGVQGDLLWRQNVAGMPVFGPALAILFYMGLLLSIWRWRDARYAFFTLWISCAVIPSVMTVDAPSSIRMINILPVLAIPSSILLLEIGQKRPFRGSRTAVAQNAAAVDNPQVIHRNSWLSTVIPTLSTDLWINSWITLLTITTLLFYGWQTSDAIFNIWAKQEEEVRFVWQASLTEMARYIDERPEIEDVTIVGWTPATMDAPTMALTLQREDVELRHTGQVGEVQTAVIPANPSGQSYLMRPTILPFNYYLELGLQEWGDDPQQIASFTLYELDGAFDPRPQVPLPANFGNELQLLGYDYELPPPFDRFEIVTYWRVLQTPTAERRIFMHMLDKNGVMLGQFDGLSAPAEFWQTGDLIMQYHTLPNNNIPFEIQMGVYHPAPPWPRLTTAEGQDFVALTLTEN